MPFHRRRGQGKFAFKFLRQQFERVHGDLKIFQHVSGLDVSFILQFLRDPILALRLPPLCRELQHFFTLQVRRIYSSKQRRERLPRRKTVLGCVNTNLNAHFFRPFQNKGQSLFFEKCRVTRNGW